MSNPISKVYDLFLKKKFFNKVLITLSLIIVLSVAVLSVFVSENVSKILETQAISFSREILSTVDIYFESKLNNLKNVHLKMLNNPEVLNSILYFLEQPAGNNSDMTITANRQIEDFIYSSVFSTDPDVKYVYLCRMNENNYQYYYKVEQPPYEQSYSDLIFKDAIYNEKNDKIKKRLYIFPSLSVPPGENIFAVYDYIWDNSDMSRITGFIAFDFNCKSIENSYTIFKKQLKGNILILREDGKVLYDSTGRYYNKTYPKFSMLQNSKSDTVYFNNGLLTLKYNDKFDFYTVCEIPYTNLYKDINALKKMIFTITLIVILVILVLTYITTRSFSKRIEKIIQGIKHIQRGEFKTKIDIPGTEDEIGLIAANINHMSDRLHDYIQKEYILTIRQKEAEIKQKNAELYALQAQINPHFLYNTLEAIRMKALTLGENEVSKMIRILSTLFRSTIKDEWVVRIGDEIVFCQSYLELFNLRYADKLKVNFQINEAIHQYGIIKHILQPLVENSLIHGINPAHTDNRITIAGYKSDDDIIITITDNGKGIDKERLELITSNLDNPLMNTDKIGILNVNHRIKLIYGDEYGISIESKYGIGTVITIKLQALTVKELNCRVQGADS